MLQRVTNPNSTFKTTFPKRFASEDKIIVNHIANDMAMADIGCSSGQTTIDFIAAFEQSGKNVGTVHGYDLNLCFFEEVKSTYLSLLKIGEAYIGIKIFFWVAYVKPRKFTKIFGITYLVNRLLDYCKPRKTQRVIKHQITQPHPKIEFRELNIVEAPLPVSRYDFVRVCNVLNVEMFEVDDIERAVRNLAASLKDGGHLLIMRSDLRGANNGTLFEKVGVTFREKYRFGEGTELMALIPCSKETQNSGPS